jgi:hypothetical protein
VRQVIKFLCIINSKIFPFFVRHANKTERASLDAGTDLDIKFAAVLLRFVLCELNNKNALMQCTVAVM